MKVVLDVKKEHKEISITIHCPEVDDTVQKLLDLFKSFPIRPPLFVGIRDKKKHLLKPEDIRYFYSENNTVYAVTEKGHFKITEKLYELEKILPAGKFVRLSKSVIANLYELSHFEASFNGTLCVYFHSGEKEYVSRHYAGKIKEILKLNRRKNK